MLWFTVTAAAAIVLCLSLIELFTFQFSQVVILAVAASIALLVAQFELTIPKTDSIFYPKTVFAFWGIVWLGVYGGVLLAAAAVLADRDLFRTNRWAWVRRASTDIVSVFCSAVVFHFSVASFTAGNTTVLAGGFLIPNEVVFASCLMAATHFAVRSAIDVLDAFFAGHAVDGGLLNRLVASPATGHLACLAVAIVMFLTFNHFGIEFGLVLLPLAIATNAAYKIHIRNLDQKTREISEASRLHLATVEALATAIDARDQVGIGHVRRTQIYAVGLGRILEMGEPEIDALRTGALLHDIGKLAVPDHILNKPGRLTQAEMEKTKIHSSVGASILEKVGFPNPVVPTVKYHHEFWDGSGYPEGLRGTQIPLTARVLSVADAFDTLRGARPYRPAISRDDACSFMRAGAGSQFDPKIVDLLIRNLKTFEDEIESEGLGYDNETEALKFDATNSSFVEQIKRANREVFTLYSLARDFSAALSLDDTLSLYTEKVGEFVPYDACAVFLLDETGDLATAVHVAGQKGAGLQGKRVRVGEGATGYALKKNRLVENVDPALDLAFSGRDDDQDFKTMISRPIVADEKIIGAISIYSSELTNFQDEHLRLLDTVSRIAADAIAKSLRHAEAATHAHTDPITGLPNARSLQVEFEKELKRSERSNSTFQVLMLDLDGFKAVNDSFGHKVGDQLLTQLGGVIRSQLRDYDFLARYAGDEFVALLPETDEDGVEELCQRIESAVNDFEIRISETESARVGVSIGSAAFPGKGESFDQLIIAADKAMYAEKAGRKLRRTTLPVEPVFHVAEMLEPAATAEEYVPEARPVDGESLKGELLVVELDETHVIATTSVN